MEMPEELRDDWKHKLLLTPTHTPKPIIANAITAFREAPEWQGVLAYDEFALTTLALLPPPWLRSNCWEPLRWTDREDVLATNWLQHQKICVTVSVAGEAVETVAKDAAFHPIRDFLGGLTWDGVPRVEEFAATYLGAERTAYHCAVSRCMLIAAVARVMRPGCKADYMAILEGLQDAGKSTVIEILFAPWFSDDLAEMGSKDASMQVRCAWGIEIAELASMTRSEIERIKAFITRKVDRFRPSYGRRVIEVPRQSVFIGSTNADAYLRDETGGRRFWPIRCGSSLKVDELRRDRDQLWAEAKAMFDAGAPWWLVGDDVAGARAQQEERRVADAWEAQLAEWCAGKESVSVGEILSDMLFLEKAKWTQADQNRIARCLIALGWVRKWRATYKLLPTIVHIHCLTIQRASELNLDRIL